MNQRTSDADETLSRLGDLARRTLQAQADAAKQSIELGRAVLSPGTDPAAASRAWAEAVGREGTRYWREVGTLGMDVAGQLLTLGSRSVARVIGETQAAVSRSRGGRSGSGTARRASAGTGTDGDDAEAGGGGAASPTATAGNGVAHVTVGLRGAPGETASGRVVLANGHPRARRVVLSPGEARPDSGRDVSLPITVDPAAVTIPAHDEQAVSVEVALLSDTVQSGERYTGEIRVTGGVEAVVDVLVDVG